MTLRQRIEETPGRSAAFALGVCFTLSSLSLLSEGLGHLRWFLPGAAANLAVGAFASERIARIFLALEACAIFGLLGYQIYRLYERHAA